VEEVRASASLLSALTRASRMRSRVAASVGGGGSFSSGGAVDFFDFDDFDFDDDFDELFSARAATAEAAASVENGAATTARRPTPCPPKAKHIPSAAARTRGSPAAGLRVPRARRASTAAAAAAVSLSSPSPPSPSLLAPAAICPRDTAALQAVVGSFATSRAVREETAVEEEAEAGRGSGAARPAAPSATAAAPARETASALLLPPPVTPPRGTAAASFSTALPSALTERPG